MEKSDGRTIKAVTPRIPCIAETEHRIAGDIFINCMGDTMAADMTGCECCWGSEGFDEFQEPHAIEDIRYVNQLS
ncbi:hypothetical protein LOZ80_36475 [Paenibacillus sp. HWE-109]|uniref:hypothetical protein n=1 Tax=Paenibacillus sp. HWE-109 TaxID=1306526 RepID=UPI001EDDB731|nr:hypothetical protein [Paenibacillus sp. HWE-109]UKS26900.1 hypothetical protein LOZ80_36475 [Paenibacillus sp. HWE-109]